LPSPFTRGSDRDVDRKALGFVLLLAASAAAGYDATIAPRPEDRVAHEECAQQGFDPGTTEFVNCVDELSQTGLQ
jgi:hypothetical protein